LEKTSKLIMKILRNMNSPRPNSIPTILVEVFLKDLRKQSCKAEPEKEAAY
jgi:hypothetical protein